MELGILSALAAKKRNTMVVVLGAVQDEAEVAGVEHGDAGCRQRGRTARRGELVVALLDAAGGRASRHCSGGAKQRRGEGAARRGRRARGPGPGPARSCGRRRLQATAVLPGSGEALWSREEADERARRQRTTDAGAGARGAPLLEHSGDEDLARRRRGRGLVLQREARGIERERVRWGSG